MEVITPVVPTGVCAVALVENATARIAAVTSRLKDSLLFMNPFLHDER
jgi:hypothetical protein